MKSAALLLQNFFLQAECAKWSSRPSHTIELLYSTHRTPGYIPSILDSEGRKAAPVAMAIRFASAFLHLLTAMAPASTKYYKHQTNRYLTEKHNYKHFKLSSKHMSTFHNSCTMHTFPNLQLSSKYSICNRSDLPSNKDHQSHQYRESHLLLLQGFSVSSPSSCLILVV